MPEESQQTLGNQSQSILAPQIHGLPDNSELMQFARGSNDSPDFKPESKGRKIKISDAIHSNQQQQQPSSEYQTVFVDGKVLPFVHVKGKKKKAKLVDDITVQEKRQNMLSVIQQASNDSFDSSLHGRTMDIRAASDSQNNDYSNRQLIPSSQSPIPRRTPNKSPNVLSRNPSKLESPLKELSSHGRNSQNGSAKHLSVLDQLANIEEANDVSGGQDYTMQPREGGYTISFEPTQPSVIQMTKGGQRSSVARSTEV